MLDSVDIPANLTPDQKIQPLSTISGEITKSPVEKATGRDFKRITDCQRIKQPRYTTSTEWNTSDLHPNRTPCIHFSTPTSRYRGRKPHIKRLNPFLVARSLSDEIDQWIKAPFVMNWSLQRSNKLNKCEAGEARIHACIYRWWKQKWSAMNPLLCGCRYCK